MFGNGGLATPTPTPTLAPTPTPTPTPIVLAGGQWNPNKGVCTPKLVDGLIPVTINSDGTLNELNANNLDNWYDYTNTFEPKWANAITKNKDGKITGYWVWIPRYEYKINTSTKDVTVKFIDVEQTTVDSGYQYIHPAFRDGHSTNYMNGEWRSEIPGFWVSKFAGRFPKK